MAGHAQDDTAVASFSVGTDGRARIEIPSRQDLYHVLRYRWDADDAATENAVSIHMGASGTVTLTEPLGAAAGGSYRVKTFGRNAPGDADADGVDDLRELAREEGTERAPLNSVPPFGSAHGALSIPDMTAFRELSYTGTKNWADPHLDDLEHVKFMIEWHDRDNPRGVYYQNTNTYTHHFQFFDGTGMGRKGGSRWLKGEVIHHPHMRGPNGAVGVFRYQFQPWDALPFHRVAKAQEALAATMPFLRNNLAYYLMPDAAVRYEREKAQYDASRVHVMDDDDVYANLVFGAVNPAVGYGLLRVLAPGEWPTSRDIAILRRLPNNLPAVAGAISLVPQTPLSHVNLRAVQDGVPNAWIRNALEDEAITALIGKYVRLEVKEPRRRNKRVGASYTIQEATAGEVATHHADRRPAEAQTPTRDLTVTTYRDLDAIGFADAGAFGVKAANLAALRTFGFAAGTVPDGYALPFHFYDAFMEHNGFYADIDALLADTDFQADIAVRDAELAKLRRRIRNGAVPDWMATTLAEVQALFPAGTPIRCRSSTNNEDLPGFSGAGLYDSYTHHPGDRRLSKSIKQVFASLWNLRAFEEREFHRVDHKAAAMGVLLHRNYSGEKANGVAISDDPFLDTANSFYVNAQVGEELVTNPSSSAVPEELLLDSRGWFGPKVVQHSNLVADGERVLSEAHVATLQAALRTIHSRFRTLYAVAEDEAFAMEIEFKITAADTFAVKQARPWVY